MSTFNELKEEAGKLGIRVPFGTSKENLEKLIADNKEPKLTPSAPSESEDEGDKLAPPPQAKADMPGTTDPDAPSANDYLWLYEIDRNTKQPHYIARTIPTKPAWKYRQPDRERAKVQKKRLLGERRVVYIIPRPEGEQGEITQTYNVNAYHLELPKNQKLELPESVVDLFMDSFKQTQDALNSKLFKNAKGQRVS